MSKVKNFFF